MRHLRPLSAKLTCAALLGAVALSAVLFLALRRDQTLATRQETASDRVLRSPLLPDDGWRTYGSDVWSVGYPDHWTVKQIQESGGSKIVFTPPDERLARGEVYFAFQEDLRTQQEIETAYAVIGMTKSEFLFAGYPALKYASNSGREEYFLFYNDRVFYIVTDYPKEEDVGIMLATFQFQY